MNAMRRAHEAGDSAMGRYFSDKAGEWIEKAPKAPGKGPPVPLDADFWG